MTAETQLRISVLALFVDRNEVLLLHQMTPPEPDCWDLPGGGLDPAEDLLTGLQREVLEETGIQHFTVEALLTVIEGFYPRDYGQLHTLNLVYRCQASPRPTTFNPTDLEEVGPKGIQWHSIADLSRDQCSRRTWESLIAAGLITQDAS